MIPSPQHALHSLQIPALDGRHENHVGLAVDLAGREELHGEVVVGLEQLLVAVGPRRTRAGEWAVTGVGTPDPVGRWLGACEQRRKTSI